MRKREPIAAALAGAFVLCCIMPIVAGAQASFPAKDTKTAATVGTAVFWVHPKYRSLVSNLDGWDASKNQFTIKNMQDLKSQIANSDQHLDDDAADINGTAVGDDNTIVSDSDFIALPVTVFTPGPPNTKEVHTEIYKLKMVKGDFTLRAGPGADVKDPDKKSLGEVEAKQASSVFPAESFFNVFVEIDTPFKVGTGVLYNKAPLIVVADNLNSFPPTAVYTHRGTSEAVPIFFKGHHGPPFGHLILAGHGVNVEVRPFHERMERVKPMKCSQCKDKGKPITPPGRVKVPPGQIKKEGGGGS
jgi:hypothetical protein